MSTYLIGDIHGCYSEFCMLLEKINFDSEQDQLWITGDLVARGPDSLNVLRYVKSLGKCVRLVLGNHDLRLLAIYNNIIREGPQDQLNQLLKAPDADELINWLRNQPLLQVDEDKKLLMSHAGIAPQWDLETVKMCAQEITMILSSNRYTWFLRVMNDNSSNNWNLNLKRLSRLCFSINALTRMRFCFPDGQLDLIHNGSLNSVLPPLEPWFMLQNKIDSSYTIVFGHWAALKGKNLPDKIIGLDTGCCWGGLLTLFHWEKQQYYTQESYFK